MDSTVAGLRVQRKNKQTGTIVSLYDGGPAGMDTFSGRWQTVCEDHSHIVSHRVYAVALSHLSHPDEWCDGCMPPTVKVWNIEELDSQFAMVEVRVEPDTRIFSDPADVEQLVKDHLSSVGYIPAELAQDWEHQDGSAFQKWIIMVDGTTVPEPNEDLHGFHTPRGDWPDRPSQPEDFEPYGNQD